MHHISSKCDLLTEDGKCVDSSMDSKVEFHFNALLDAIADQKNDVPEDQSLEGVVKSLCSWWAVWNADLPIEQP